MDTTVMDLGEDMSTEILARLPVLALLRCKCVCKSWLDLITSTSFIAKHFEVCNSNRDPNLLIRNKSYYYIVYPGALKELALSHKTVPHIQPVEWPRMVGSCDGLVCNYGHGVGVIWNPATGETMVMPPCSVQGSETQAVGFGFDATENDYKVCVIHLFHTGSNAGPYSDTEGEAETESEAKAEAETKTEAKTETEVDDNANADAADDDDLDADDDSDSDVEWLKIEVYSLRLESWKLVTGIKMMKKKLFYIVEEVGAHNNGVISWVAYGERKDPEHKIDDSGVAWKEEMISFDINKEVITRTPLPTDIAVHKATAIHNYVGLEDGDLAVLNESMDVAQNGLFRLFKVWKLPEIGSKDSWKKSLEITESLEWYSPTWVVWNGCLVFQHPMSHLILPDLEVVFFFHTKELKRRRFGIPKEEGYKMDFVTYRESLVSIKRRGTIN